MMENKNRTGCAVLAFALLLAGCAQASDGDVDTSAGQGETIVSEETNVEASGNNASGEIVGLTSEDYQPGIGNSVVMETESGFYYYGFPEQYTEEGMVPGFCYHDRETGTDIYLCSKPECAHDGNAYCVATSDRPEDFALYDGSIYTVVMQEEDETTEWKLYRIALDGTEKTEVSTFEKMKNAKSEIDSSDYGHLICHRGKAVYTFQYSDLENSAYTFDGIDCACGVVIDLSTGKSEEIKLEGDLIRYSERGLEDMLADGDWLYFCLRIDEDGTAVPAYWRYNLETKVSEQLDLPENLYSYTAINGKVYYTQQVPGEELIQIWVYDTQTQETTALCDPYAHDLHIPNTQQSPCLKTDGKYLYYADHGFMWFNYEDEPSEIHVLTLEGEELGSIQKPALLDAEKSYMSECYFKDGTVYMVAKIIQNAAKSCYYTRDVLDADAEWALIYEAYVWN
jgi:hypothetical protein